MVTVTLLLLCFGLNADAQQQVSFGAIAPPGPTSVGASAFGARGGTILYYWVVARYPGGASTASMTQAFGTVGGGNLTGSNFVRVSWAPAAGATGYDVLRSDLPIYPGPCAACAVVLNTASASVDDTGGALSAYPPGGLNAAVPVNAFLTVNNRDDATPYVNLQLLSIRLNELLRVGLVSGTPAENDCIKWSAGRLASAGAPCGSGGPGDPNMVTAAGTLGSNAPVIGAGSKTVAVGTRSGNTTEFGTVSGTKTASKQLAFDASGNITASAYDVGAAGSDTRFQTSVASNTATIAAGVDGCLNSSGYINSAAVASGSVAKSAGSESGRIRIARACSGGVPVLVARLATTLTLGNFTCTNVTCTSGNDYVAGDEPLAEVDMSTGTMSAPSDKRVRTASHKPVYGFGLTDTGNGAAVNSGVIPVLAGATTGMPVGSVASDPSAPSNGDCWYNTTTNTFKCRENGTTKTMISSGSGGGVQRVAFASQPTCDSSITNVLIKYTDVYFPVSDHCNGTSYQSYYGDLPVTRPSTSGWTVHNSPTVDSSKGVYQVVTGTSNLFYGAVRAVPASSNFTVTAGFETMVFDATATTNYPTPIGFCVTDGNATSNKRQCIAIYINGSSSFRDLIVATSTGATDWAGTGASTSNIFTLPRNFVGRIYFEYQDNGTNRIFRIGMSRNAMVDVLSQSRTTHLTATHIGFYSTPGATSLAQNLSLFDWREQ